MNKKDVWLNENEKTIYLQHVAKVKKAMKKWLKQAKKENKKFYSKHTICIV